MRYKGDTTKLPDGYTVIPFNGKFYPVQIVLKGERLDVQSFPHPREVNQPLSYTRKQAATNYLLRKALEERGDHQHE